VEVVAGDIVRDLLLVLGVSGVAVEDLLKLEEQVVQDTIVAEQDKVL
jgi:hypothetical protein